MKQALTFTIILLLAVGGTYGFNKIFPRQTKVYTIRLTSEEANTVLQSLTTQPMKDVYNLYFNISGQIQAQNQPPVVDTTKKHK